MQALLQTLQDHDVGHLRIIAELWGVDPPTGNALQAAEILALSMLDPQALAEIRDGLPPNVAQVLDLLLLRGGRLPLADLTRRAGLLRRMGPGKRDRERPWRSPASPLEFLWYRGLIATAFADTPTGPKEFAFIPWDLFALIPKPPSQQADAFIPPTDPPDVQHQTTTAAADDAATLLAAMRRQPSAGSDLTHERRQGLAPFLLQPSALQLLLALLVDLGILAANTLVPDPTAARNFLALSRHEALALLAHAWVGSARWNDLAHVPTLSTAGKAWPSDPLTTRGAVLEFLRGIPASAWHDIDTFIETVYNRQPDFQRPGGDFDSWYLQHTDSGAFLQGFNHWDQIEGALLRFMIYGPLHWLGIADLGRRSNESAASAFRLTSMVAALFDTTYSPQSEEQAQPAEVRPDGRITVPRQASPSMRYQIARFCTWLSLDEDGYQFALSPSSLKHAQDQGLQLKHIQAILAESSEAEIPPALLKALRRWGKRGREAHLEHGTVLRVANAGLLDKLIKRPATARFLGERLGPTAVLLRERDLQPMLDAAVRFGLLIDPVPPEGGVGP